MPNLSSGFCGVMFFFALWQVRKKKRGAARKFFCFQGRGVFFGRGVRGGVAGATRLRRRAWVGRGGRFRHRVLGRLSYACRGPGSAGYAVTKRACRRIKLCGTPNFTSLIIQHCFFRHSLIDFRNSAFKVQFPVPPDGASFGGLHVVCHMFTGDFF